MEFLETAITLSLICKEEAAILILATRIFQPVQIQQVPKGVIWFWFLQFYEMCLGDVQDTIVISIVDLYVSFWCWMPSRLKNNNSVWNGKWARKLKFFWILVGCFNCMYYETGLCFCCYCVEENHCPSWNVTWNP